ncbi:hypothetical protein ACNQR7_32140 [Mycolicibacterium senegalense]|uniref:hypothetical protein n=1 Tax=Mycolicibacterium senegalense TaxID=1796 RepID=UPI003AB0C53F
MSIDDVAPPLDGTPTLTLPDAEIVFGVGADLRHAVTRKMALRSVGEGSIRDAVAGSVCGQLVRLAASWGAYEPDSRYLQHGHVCTPCAWIVAGAQDRLPEMIASITPSEKNMHVITAALGDPLASVRLLEAIVTDDDLGDNLAGRFRRSQRADVLAHAVSHLPSVVVCEDCAERPAADGGDDCSCAVALCMTCTLTSGPWAGEWEGYTLDECTVESPCSALRSLCHHYKIALPQQRAEGPDSQPTDRSA